MSTSRAALALRRGARLARRARARIRRTEGAGVSVVVTARASHAPFLEECLRSLSHQTFDHLQVIVVPYGEASRPVLDVARRVASGEPRLVVAEGTDAATLGAARNAGAALATKSYLVFVGGGDVLPRPALGRLVDSLEGSGSDFARGAITLGRSRPGDLPPGHRAEPARGTSVHQAPWIVSDLFVEGTLFRRSYWQRHSLRFADTDGPELDVCSARSHLEAASFDVLAEPTYRFMDRGTGRVVGVAPDHLRDLDAWLRAQEQIRSMLTHASETVRHAWLLGVIDSSLTAMLESSERATPEEWTRLRTTVQSMVDLGGEGLLAEVPVVARLLVWLACEDRREELEDLVAERRLERNDFPTVVDGGVVLARLPTLRDPRRPVPDELLVLGPVETSLSTSVQRVRWREDDQLELVLFAMIRYVSVPHGPASVTAWLRDPDTGERFELVGEQFRDPGATRFGRMRWQNYDGAGLSVLVDVRRLAELVGSDPTRTWHLEVELTHAGVTRSGRVTHRIQGGSAGLAHPRSVGGRVVCLSEGAEPFELTVRTPAARLLEVGFAGRVVDGLVAVDGGDAPRTVVATRTGHRVTAALERTEAGDRFRLELPPGDWHPDDPGERRWTLRVASEQGRQPVAWPEGWPRAWRGEGPEAELALHRTPRGNCELLEVSALALVEEVELGASELLVAGSWLGRPPTGCWTLAGRGERVRLGGSVRNSGEDGRFEVGLSLEHDEWGLGPAPVPVGTYRLVVQVAADEDDAEGPGQDIPVFVGDDLEERLPVEQLGSDFRCRVGRGPAGRPLVRLQKPLREEEMGTYAQRLLRERYRSSTAPLDENAVYLQSYSGHTATDSPLALHHELRRTHPHLKLYWGVADRSTRLPEGAVPLLMYSAEWYDVLARAKYLVNNIDFDRFFVRREGQRFLQTFHGYPSKSMGIGMWRSKRFGPRQIEAELDRTARGWDLILTPAPEMDEYYRREYDYEGPILSHGYPRDDVLVGDEAESIRRRTRELLGIRDDQVVVLYAPTWRDDLATSYRSSPLVRHLDLEAASRALGDGYVLLMRGHRFHSREQRSSTDARLVDVTSYPEVNDLILASDAAVLDYSSLRFDFALTGRPMLFLVPDLEAYTTGARGFLFPFQDSAPGPLLRHADDVVDRLRDLEAVGEEFGPAYAQFNRTYNYLQDGRSSQHVVAAFFGEGPPRA